MIELLITCGVLTIALLALLVPAIYRRSAGSTSGVRTVLLVLVISTPLISALIYLQMGASADIKFYRMMQEYTNAPAEQQIARQTEFLYALQQRAEKNPESGEYWYLLGMHRFAAGMYAQAAEAYEQSAEIFTEDATILAKWAEALYLSNDFSLTPQIQSLIGRVLAINPNEPTVLGISGIAAFEAGFMPEAIAFWQRALSQLPPNSANAAMMNEGITQARQRMAASGETVESDASAEMQQASEQAEQSTAVVVNLSVAPGLDVEPSDAIFLFLRQPSMPMPLVVQRLSVAALPVTMRLDESQAMIPGTKLDQLPAVEVVARITKSGSVTTSSGDYEAVYGPLQLEAGELIVDIEIETQIP